MGWVAAAIGIATSIFGGSSASSERKLAKDQATYDYLAAQEEIRRREFEQGQIEGEARVGIGASGVRNTNGSSPSEFLGTMIDEFTKEIEWMKEWAQFNRDSGMKSANIRYKSGIMNSIVNGINTGMSVYRSSQ